MNHPRRTDRTLSAARLDLLGLLALAWLVLAALPAGHSPAAADGDPPSPQEPAFGQSVPACPTTFASSMSAGNPPHPIRYPIGEAGLPELAALGAPSGERTVPLPRPIDRFSYRTTGPPSRNG